MKLLIDIGDRGYPTEYFLSRIRGRRSLFTAELQRLAGRTVMDEGLLLSPPIGSAQEIQGDGSWRSLLREYRWAYLQMNRELRKVFTPFFAFMELRTLILCFRYRKTEGGGEEVEGLLSQSLLSGGIRKKLMTGSDLVPALQETEEGFTLSSFSHPGLVQAYEQAGLRGVEEKLCAEFLEQTVRSQLHPAIMEFFRSTVDRRNISLAYKQIRWGLSSAPPFVEGGRVRRPVLKKIIDEKDLHMIADIVHTLTAMKIEEHTGAAFETALKNTLTKRIARLMRGDPETGLILDYLWRRYIEMENLNLLLYGRGVNGDVINKELVH
jgi:vacuolar-type H+-ATPase subunit C/Vma6